MPSPWVLKTFSSARSCGNYPISRALTLARGNQHLNAILDKGKEAASHAAFAFVDCALAERDPRDQPASAHYHSRGRRTESADNSLWPRNWWCRLVARLRGDTQRSAKRVRTARTLLPRRYKASRNTHQLGVWSG